MRKTLILMIAGAATALAAPTATTPAQQADAFFAKGVAAENAGDYEGAQTAYTKALQINPDLANCRYRLKELELNRAKILAKGREVKLGKVMVPAFQLDGATLQEALDALSQIIDKESKGQVAANFVLQDPNGKLASAKLSLNLKNIPASAVMKYLMTQANAKARYDEHAVVIEPK
jgi:tetratricopeptide (TPR) repeat protein